MTVDGELSALMDRFFRAVSFGKVAHRFSTYEKRGVRDGTAFAARGRISTQFARAPGGWQITSMAWDEEA
jgi:hypothetical protein